LKIEIFVGLLLLLIIEGNQLIVSPVFSKISSEFELKPLEIKGPTFAEVNETISFIVTSEGLPVKGTMVSFAGYVKETDNNGTACFQIDFAGCFKVTAEKEGFKTNSTLLWVFPRGNEKLPIRGFMAGAEQVGNTFITFRMVGANFVFIKVYYLYDKDGSVYPGIVTDGFQKVPKDLQREDLAEQIRLARAWGLKVFLIADAESLPGVPGPPPQFTTDEAKEKFLKQAREEALSLAEFAEREKVSILMPMLGLVGYPSEAFSIYREILPELRKRFSGKLASFAFEVEEIANGKFSHYNREFNYSGLDLITPLFAIDLFTDSKSELGRAIDKALDFGAYLKDKYKVLLAPIVLSDFNLFGRRYSIYQKFFENFSNHEDAKNWLTELIIKKSLERNVDGIFIYCTHFFGMPLLPHGTWENLHPYWQSRKALDIARKYFTIPFNKEKEDALAAIEYASLLANRVINETSNPALLNWVKNKIQQAFDAYRKEDCYTSIVTSQEILYFLYHIQNPLSVRLNGENEEWQFLDPFFFNPSQANNLFHCKYRYDEEKCKQWGNLKLIYATNDQENLYLLLEFYDKLPSSLPYISIDISGEWNHKSGKEFLVDLEHNSISLRIYENLSNIFRPENIAPMSVRITKNHVIELEIPLKILNYPKKVNIIVWYPSIAPWGDIKIDIVDWSTYSFPPKLSKDFYPNNLTREMLLTKLTEAEKKSGRVSSNETWRGTILITGDVTVDEDATVTVEPGTVIFVAARTDDQKSGRPSPPDRFNPKDPVKTEEYVINRVEIEISGSLIAQGTDEFPIIITSSAQDPQSDDWMGIIVHRNGRLRFERVLMEYFRIFSISSKGVRISKSILRNMMECIVIIGSEDELLTINPIITESYIYNSGHMTITVRSGSPIITHNVIYARNDMGFPGFEYGTIAVDFFAKPVIEHNFVEGGSPLKYEGYDIWGRYIRFINGSGLILHAYFGAIVKYNTFFNCSNTGIEINPYQWIIEKNNFVNNIVNVKIFGKFEPEPSDIWQQRLLENFNTIPLNSISLTNNYWGTCDENEVNRSIAIFQEAHSKVDVYLKPFGKYFIWDALPQWRRFVWRGMKDYSNITLSTSLNNTTIGENIKISGFIYPAHPNSKVTLTYTMPNGTILTRNVTTKALGEFEDIVTPNIAGNWTVRASWSGDYDHEGAKSIEISFSVLKGKSSLPLLVSKDNIKEGEQIIISGSINPPLAKAEITLTFEMPTGLTFTKAVLTDSDGSFSYVLIPKDVGIWKLHASWPGNENYEGASSPTLLFTVIALKPAEFVFTNLTITPMQAEVGQTITISVKVTNVGEQTGTYNVDLKLNGTIVNSKIVSLRGEESTIVMFELVKEEAGTFNVEISGLKGTFIVKELSLPLWQEYWYLIVSIAIISIAFFLFLMIRVKYRKV
jgi:hypothetical protein